MGGGGVEWSKKNFPKIQTDLVCELLTSMAHGNRTKCLVPTPWGPGEGPKGQVSFNLNHKVRVQRSGIYTIKYHNFNDF